MYSTTSGRAFFRPVTDETEHIIPDSGEQITIYTRDNCQQCRAVKRRLTEAGAQFREVNTSRDEAAADKLRDAGFMQAPVTYFGFEAVSGYNPGRIDALLESFPTHV